MTSRAIIDALAAILEDIFLFKMDLPLNEELEAFFEPEQMAQFKELVRQEFDLDGDSIVDTALSFRELVYLIQDEVSF